MAAILLICSIPSGESLKKTHLMDSSSDIMNMEEGSNNLFSPRIPVDYSKVMQYFNLVLVWQKLFLDVMSLSANDKEAAIKAILTPTGQLINEILHS